MAPINSVPIRLSHRSGAAYWDPIRQTYSALLRLFDDDRSYPPSWARFGMRVAEFLTPDALVNHLAGIGLEADDGSVLALQWLARHVAETEGEPELVGLVDDAGGRRLVVRTPAGSLIGLNPRLAHDDYGVHWGDAGPATVETARLICEQAFVRRPGADVESFALTLTYEYLSELDGDFSLGLGPLCDWYLTDAELATSLLPADLCGIRAQLGLQPTPVVASDSQWVGPGERTPSTR